MVALLVVILMRVCTAYGPGLVVAVQRRLLLEVIMYLFLKTRTFNIILYSQVLNKRGLGIFLKKNKPRVGINGGGS